MRPIHNLWQARLPLLALAVLQALDIWSTHLAVSLGAPEGNPVVNAMLGGGGFTQMALVKFAVLGLAFLLVAVDPGRGPYVHAALWIMDGVMALVVGLNLAAYGIITGAWEPVMLYLVLLCAVSAVAWKSVWDPRPTPTLQA